MPAWVVSRSIQKSETSRYLASCRGKLHTGHPSTDDDNVEGVGHLVERERIVLRCIAIESERAFYLRPGFRLSLRGWKYNISPSETAFRDVRN